MATTFLTVKNRALSTLASGITDIATSLTVATGEGALFPSTFSFHITIDNEILNCTSRTTDVLTVTRAAESTTAAAHSAAAQVSLNITAQLVSDLDTAVNAIENQVAYPKLNGWTDEKLLKGAGAGVAPDEIDVPSGSYQGVRLYHSGLQSIPNAAYAMLAFDSESFDNNNFHDTVTNNSRITIPAGKGGNYLIIGKYSSQPSGTGQRISGIYKNGNTILTTVVYSPTSGADYAVPTAVTIENLAAGNYIEVRVYQNSGAALNANGGVDGCLFAAHQLF